MGFFSLAGGLPLVAELPGGAAEPYDGEGGGVFALEGSYFAFDLAEGHGFISILAGLLIGRDWRLCGSGASGEKRVFPLISAHFRSFPLIPVRISRGAGACGGGGKPFFRSFPLISVQIGRSVSLTYMCSIALRSMLPGVFRVGKGRVSAGLWQSYCRKGDLTNIYGQDWNSPQRR